MNFIGPVIFATAAPMFLFGTAALILHLIERRMGYTFMLLHGPRFNSEHLIGAGIIVGALFGWGRTKMLHADGITLADDMGQAAAAWHDTSDAFTENGTIAGHTIGLVMDMIAQAFGNTWALTTFALIIAVTILYRARFALIDLALFIATSTYGLYSRSVGRWHQDVQAEIHESYGWTPHASYKLDRRDHDVPTTATPNRLTTAEHAEQKGRADVLQAFLNHANDDGDGTNDTWDDLTPDHRAAVLKAYTTRAVDHPFNPANVQTSPDYLHHENEDVATAYTEGIERGTVELVMAINEYRRREQAAGRALSLAGQTVQAALELDADQQGRAAHQAFDALMGQGTKDTTSTTDSSSTSDT